MAGGTNRHLAISSLVSLGALGACVAPETPGRGPDPAIDEPAAALVGCAPATPSGSLTGVWIAPAGIAWAVGDDGTIGRRSGAGATWEWCRLPGDARYRAIWGAADDDVWIAGAAGTLLRWRGTTFERIDAGTAVDLEDVWGASATSVFVVGDGGVARHFDGATWQTADVATDALEGVWGASATDVWIAGQRHFTTTLPSGTELDSCEAQIFRWNGGTRAFSREVAFTQQHGECAFLGVGGSSAADVWAVGREFPAGSAAPFAFAVHHDGRTWTRATPADEELTIDRSYTDVAARAPGAENGAWVAASGVTAVRIDGAGASAADTITADLADLDTRGDAMFAVGADAKILRWAEGGWVREL